MSGSVDRRDSAQPGSIAVLCREFQDRQDSGQTPAIEEYLSRVGADEQPSLLVELVVLDLDARRRAGEQPALDEYVRRFPEHGALLRDRLSPGFDSADPSMGSTVSRAYAGTAGSILLRQHAELQPKSTLGRYELIERLGRGAFGEVWKARDPGLSRLVAIKTLRSDCTFPEAAVRSFLVEGQRLAQLRHTGIVCVYDVGVEAGRVYIVSELVDGETLATRLEHETSALPPAEAAAFVAQVADAVHYAHLQGIVHRDIKPSNILLDRSGRPLLADFGLAITEEDQLSEPAAAVGTLAYMSPEQFRGESHRADGRADVYSLGVILYRMLTGRLPFKANSREQWRDQILHRSPRPPRMINDSIPAALEAVCLKCLSKRVEERYTTAADLAEGLRAVDHLTKPVAVPASRTWGHFAVAAALLCAAVSIVVTMSPLLFERRLESPARARVPEQLLWPAVNDGSAHFSVTDDGRSLQLTCERFALLGFAEIEDEDGELVVSISQHPWLGSVGVFWGFERPLPDTRQLEFQVLMMDRGFDRDYFVGRFAVPIHRETGEDLNLIDISRAAIAPPGVGAHELRLQFRKGTPVEAAWDGMPLDLFRDGKDQRLQPEDNRGRLGVFVQGRSASFTDVRWNGERLTFSKRPAAD